MGSISGPLEYLLLSWGVITGILILLLIYRTTLASREDDQIFIGKTEENMMASEQRELIGKMNRLGRPIITLSVLSGALLLATAGMWVWIGFKSS
jgi:hypothetical protein